MSEMFSDVVVNEVRQLEEGKYKGQIVNVTRDTSKFDYTNYQVAIEGENMSLIVGFPTGINILSDGKPSTQHGKFVNSLGLELVKNKFPDVESLIGTKITFLVANNTNDQGTFSEIVKKTVKLIE